MRSALKQHVQRLPVLCVFAMVAGQTLCALAEHMKTLSRHVLACMLPCVSVFTLERRIGVSVWRGH